MVVSRGCLPGKPLLLTPCPVRKWRRREAVPRRRRVYCSSNEQPCEVSESVVTVRTTTASLQNGLTHTTRVEEVRRTTTTTAPSPRDTTTGYGGQESRGGVQQLLCMAEAPPPGSLAASSLMYKGLGVNMGSLLLGVVLTLGVQLSIALILAHQSTTRFARWLRIMQRQWKFLTDGGPVTASSSEFRPPPPPDEEEEKPGAIVLYQDQGESVEWFNMCWRKIWRVYQRGLERWIMDLLQPLFDMLCQETGYVPTFLQRIKIVEFTLDHEAPYFSNMRRRTSRKDSDLSGVVDVRYTGGARMLLMLEVGQGRWRFKIPVMVSDLDLECKMWVKIRLAPICPWLGQISLAFVGPPNVKVQLSPYNRVRLMRIPVLQTFLSKLLTVDLPGLMVLPQRIEINIPPSVTSVAEAAVGRDTIMRAVASAVLEADAAEQALLSALPLGPQTPAGGIILPEGFCGELTVKLKEARNLPVWGFPWQSNPYCRMVLGEQAVRSRRDDDTSHEGDHRAPVWNQEFQFLVQDLNRETLEISVRDSHLTGKPDVGHISFSLNNLPDSGTCDVWLPLEVSSSASKNEGEVRIEVTYRSFEEDENDSGYREAELFARSADEQVPIKDIQSAAAASSRAAVAASAAAAAIAITKAAAARAAAKAARAAKAAASGNLAALNFDSDEEDRNKGPRPPSATPRPAPQPSQEETDWKDALLARLSSLIQATQGPGQQATVGVDPTQQPGSRNFTVDVDGVARPATAQPEAPRPGSAVDATTQTNQNTNGTAAAATAATRAAGTSGPAEAVAPSPTPASRRAGIIAPSPAAAAIAAAAEAEAAKAAAARGAMNAPISAAGNGALGTYPNTASYPPYTSNGAPVNGAVYGKGMAYGQAPGGAPKFAKTDSPITNEELIAMLAAQQRSQAGVQGGGAPGSSAATSCGVEGASGYDPSYHSHHMHAHLDPKQGIVVDIEPDLGKEWTLSSDDEAGFPQWPNDAPNTRLNGQADAASTGQATPTQFARSPPTESIANTTYSAPVNGSDSSYDRPGYSGDANGYTVELADSRVTSAGVDSSRVDSVVKSVALGDNQTVSAASVVTTQVDTVTAVGISTLTTDPSTLDLSQLPAGSDRVPSGSDRVPTGVRQAGPSARLETLAVAAAEPVSQEALHRGQLLSAALLERDTVTLPDTLPRPPPGSLGVSDAGSRPSSSADGMENGPTEPGVRSTGGWVGPSGSRDGGDWAQTDAEGSGWETSQNGNGADSRSSNGVDGGSVKPPEEGWSWGGVWGAVVGKVQDFLPKREAPSPQEGAGNSSSDGSGSNSGVDGALGEQGTASGKEAGAEGERAGEAGKEGEEGKPWWSFLPKINVDIKWGGNAKEEVQENGAADGNYIDGTMQDVVIPPDLPLEEIAKEVAKLKKESWKSKEDHVSNLWAKAVEKNDRSWIMLLCFLVTTAICLLVFALWRIDGIDALTGL